VARRLLLTYLTITALTLAVVVIPLGRIFADRERDRLVFDIERDAQAVASLVEDDLEAGTAPPIDTVLADYGDGGRIIVVNTDGVSVADSDNLGGAPGDFSTRPEVAAALDGQRSTGTRHSETLGTDLTYVAVPVASGGAVHGAVRVTYPTSTLDARVRSTWVRLGLLSVVVLVTVAAVGMLFARGVTRPVRKLQQAARRLAAGDLTARVDTGDGAPELRSLAETFNATARQLAQLVESQQRFVADASHQLRTPLTALRLRLETLTPFVAEPARPKLDAAISETNRLARLVHSLLVLARSDAARPVQDILDLADTVTDRVDFWSPAAADQDASLVSECPDEVWVYAVPGALEQILDNLVSNALDVAPDATSVTIRVVPGGASTELHVTDQGPGMTPEERQRAFERFWRPARAPGTDSGDGFGLGLAIVHQLAARCGGDARLEPGPDGVGLDAVVTLRSAHPPAFGDAHRRPNEVDHEPLPDAHLEQGERSPTPPYREAQQGVRSPTGIQLTRSPSTHGTT
jgi:signal transduction histidine kinase